MRMYIQLLYKESKYSHLKMIEDTSFLCGLYNLHVYTFSVYYENTFINIQDSLRSYSEKFPREH